MTQDRQAGKQGSATVSISRLAHLDEGWEDLDVVRERIRTGHAYLKVVEYPWGVELEVVNVGGRE